ncbi:hypothetical protein GFS24_03685 [Chitinophaga sp. SYP-B3965]|uniref:hypothetical protein n=1 Tax=Chitinophaga sp. SYP-B3965 TaxID=2663120 RepID=UPI00129A04A7|nr:hypothetical protein [Chitinophaga sp. SYP-B3965]MRG44198.1 hypothetical protein [Chitinophaga sp. SYP-B3965]
MTVTWIEIFPVAQYATIRHFIALALVILNLGLYFFSFRYAVLMTGVILLLATFDLAAFTNQVKSDAFYITIAGLEISTPFIQGWSLLILIIFLILNFKFLKNSLAKSPGK